MKTCEQLSRFNDGSPVSTSIPKLSILLPDTIDVGTPNYGGVESTTQSVGYHPSRVTLFGPFYLFMVASVAALSGTARGLIIPGLRISEVLSVVILGVTIFQLGFRFRFFSTALGAVALYCSVFSFIGLLHMQSRPELGLASIGEEVLANWQYFFLAIALANVFTLPQREQRMTMFLMSLGFWASVESIIALLQILRFTPALALGTLVTGNTEILNTPNWKVPRGTGLFNSWHAMGAFTGLCAALLLWAYLSNYYHGRTRRYLFIALVLCTIGVVSALTAAPIILVAVVAVALTMRFKKSLPIVAFLLVGGSLLIFGPIRLLVMERINRQIGVGSSGFIPQTIEYRVDVWIRDYFPIISDHLWVGYGSSTGDLEIFAHTESMYIWLLFHGGLWLFAAFTILLMALAHEFHPKKSVSLSALALDVRFVIRVVLLSLLPLMVIHPYLKDAGGSHLFFCLVGIGVGLARPQKIGHDQIF
jgi:hypothetical protein